jgi:restriction system protein
MAAIDKCLKEWNATIEALGQGYQTILIRNYSTNVNEFLLYPTVNYALKDDYLDNFQNKYTDFVLENAIPKKKGDKVLIKYYAIVEDIVKKPVSRIPSTENYIWTRSHVKNYITGQIAFIWVLRVYKLKEPYWAKPTPGAIKYANLKKKVSLEGIEPVLNNSKFEKITKSYY